MTNRERLLAAFTEALDKHPGLDEAGLESVGVTWYKNNGTVKLRPEYSETVSVTMLPRKQFIPAIAR